MANRGGGGEKKDIDIKLLKEKLTVSTLLMKHKCGGRICAQ